MGYIILKIKVSFLTFTNKHFLMIISNRAFNPLFFRIVQYSNFDVASFFSSIIQFDYMCSIHLKSMDYLIDQLQNFIVHLTCSDKKIRVLFHKEKFTTFKIVKN